MNEFFNWEMLLTYSGAVLFTTLFTQLFKGVTFIEKIPTRIFSYVVALVIMVAANAVLGTLTWGVAGLCAINAIVVSLAANGAFDAMQTKNM